MEATAKSGLHYYRVKTEAKPSLVEVGIGRAGKPQDDSGLHENRFKTDHITLSAGQVVD